MADLHAHPVKMIRLREPAVGVRAFRAERFHMLNEPRTASGERHVYGITSLRCVLHTNDSLERRGCGKVPPGYLQWSTDAMAARVGVKLPSEEQWPVA